MDPLSDSEKELVTDETISEIHKLTSGQPYEINLLAHHMYARYDRGESEKLNLTSDVISDVVTQLDVWRRSVDNDAVNNIQHLKDEQLRTLILSTEFPHVPKEWLIKYLQLESLALPQDNSRVHEQKYYSDIIDSLIDDGFLIDNGGNIEFTGDLYALAYAKYSAFADGIIKNIGVTSISSRDTDLLIGNIHYRLVDCVLLEGYSNCHSHFILNSTGEEYDPIMGSIVMKKRGSGSNHNSDIEGNQALKFSKSDNVFSQTLHNEDEVNYAPEDTFSFRWDIKWMDKEFISIVHFDENNYDRVESRLETIKPHLDKIGYKIIINDEHTLVHKGDQFLEEGEYETALEHYEEALNVNSHFPFSWKRKAGALMELGQADEALVAINQALEIEEWTDSKLIKAGILAYKGNIDNSKDILEDITDDLPNDSYHWTRIACLLSDELDPDTIIEFSERALDIDPNDGHAKFHLLRSKIKNEEFQEGLELCNELWNDSGQNQEQVNYYGVLVGMSLCIAKLLKDRYDEEDIEESIELLEKSIANNPEIMNESIGSLEYNLSCLYHILGDDRKALDNLEKAVNINTDFAEKATKDPDLKELRDKRRFSKIVDNDSSSQTTM